MFSFPALHSTPLPMASIWSYLCFEPLRAGHVRIRDEATQRRERCLSHVFFSEFLVAGETGTKGGDLNY